MGFVGACWHLVCLSFQPSRRYRCQKPTRKIGEKWGTQSDPARQHGGSNRKGASMSAKRLILILLLVAPVLITAVLTTAALGQTPQLRMAVVLTRHGVRSPLSDSTTSPYQKEPWPSLDQWHVACPGDLTPRGTELVQQMGIFYHAYYADKGLLPPVSQCPASKVYIWSDNVERTLGTAHALADGMSTGITSCLMPVNSLPYTPAPHSGPSQCKANN